MRAALVVRTAVLTALSATLAACDAPSPTAPFGEERLAPSASHGASGVELLARGRSGAAQSASRVLDAKGGVIAVNGAVLVVPAGALSAPVQITLSIPAGRSVQAELQPHGLKFKVPVVLAMSLADTGVRPDKAAGELQGIYFDGQSGGAVTPREVFSVFQYGQMAALVTTHFSSYGFAKGFILVGG